MRKVSVIITHHLPENKQYLEAAVESVKNQSVPVELIVMATAQYPELTNATKKVHWAIDNLVDPSHDIMFMSDDVVIAPYTIGRLQYASGLMDCIQNPLSNNEYGSRYWGSVPFWQNSYEFDEHKIKMAMKQLPPQMLMFPVEWISFYCTYIPRSVWNKVGRLDETLDARHNDVDYCLRAQKLGIPTFINTGGFALHFGSKTLPKVTSSAEYDKADLHFKQKWGLK